MEIIKIVLVAVIGAVTFVYLKSINSELSNLLLVGVGIIILLLTVSYVFTATEFFKNLINDSGVNSNVLTLVFKITAISYLIEFSTSLCEDFGVKSIANKLEFSGKIIIFVLSIPVFKTLIETINTLSF